VTGRRSPVRAGRNRRRQITVAVLGACGTIGRRVAGLLAENPAVATVLAVDDERGDLDGVTWRIVSLRDPALVRRLENVDVVVHTGLDINITEDPSGQAQRNLRAAQTVLTACAAAAARRVVVLSSAMVYGARPDNPVPLDDDAPMQAASDGALVSDLLELEELYARAQRAHPGTALTVLRPAMLVGEGVDTVMTRHFESPRLLVIRGTEPLWQFCHVDDLAAAMATAAVRELDGPLTVASEGWLDQDTLEQVTARPRIELPETFAVSTAQRLHRLGLTPATAGDLQFVSYPWVVSSARLRAQGWRPSFDNSTAAQELVSQASGHRAVASRRIGRRETAAAFGAAGATVAVVGSAVAVRRARRRRQ